VKLAELWGRAKELVKGRVVVKVVDEMWTYLYKNTGLFTSGFSLVIECFILELTRDKWWDLSFLSC